MVALAIVYAALRKESWLQYLEIDQTLDHLQGFQEGDSPRCHVYDWHTLEIIELPSIFVLATAVGEKKRLPKETLTFWQVFISTTQLNSIF